MGWGGAGLDLEEDVFKTLCFISQSAEVPHFAYTKRAWVARLPIHSEVSEHPPVVGTAAAAVLIKGFRAQPPGKPVRMRIKYSFIASHRTILMLTPNQLNIAVVNV